MQPQSDCALPPACADTYLVAPSLTLVRSRDASNREVGIGRVSSWHSSDAVLPEVVAQGGAEALLAALPSAQPTTRVTILELLLRMAPLGDARARLAANDAAVRATEACTAVRGAGGEAQIVARCHALAADLRQSLDQARS